MKWLKRLSRRTKESSDAGTGGSGTSQRAAVDHHVDTPGQVTTNGQPPTCAEERAEELEAATTATPGTETCNEQQPTAEPTPPPAPATTSKRKPFAYTPLKQPRNFRILHLQRRLRDLRTDHRALPLEGSIVEASLDNPPEYFALSYTWGDATPVACITISGAPLAITASCAAALRRMLRGKTERLIWVDSICINQAADAAARAERNTQVAMMEDVYRRAVKVLVHLSEGTEATDVACQAIKSLQAAYLKAKVAGPLQAEGRVEYERVADDVLAYTPEFPYGKLYPVLSLPWFRRTWVFQEVALAKDVMFYCGASMMHFWTLIIAADFTRLPYSKLNSESLHWRQYLERHHAVQEFVRRHEAGEPVSNFGMSLLSLVAGVALSLEAGRPHDKIYGLYGVCARLGFRLPDPDYDKPVAVVYTEAARAIVQHDANLDILSVTEGSAGAAAFGLPSWVPDFSGSIHRWTPDNPPHLHLTTRTDKRVSGDSSWTYDFLPDGRSLRVRGRRLDIIVAVGTPWKTDHSTTLLGNAVENSGQYADSLVACIGTWHAVAQQQRKGRSGDDADADAVAALVRVLLNGEAPKHRLEPLSNATIARCLAVLIERAHTPDSVQRTRLVLPEDTLADVNFVGNFWIMQVLALERDRNNKRLR
ncbi:heterokaryon incompatibility protein-domain-containing protein [Massariosphaeria phaeospora]|uniref:Heterokaryon incompatibility protein-domain-containing protein n=1 Tax=Massariosphaeria phaeospora TaxID=100035 RepID=A0A7C8IDX5_9PLEO|nr:heterokaryon incompatibility protein-domain-containing protein [Massariosphaeria phaeospora]